MHRSNPDAETVISTLRANEAALRARGITHAALFGSRARGDNTPDSDIDILIETDPGALNDLYDYAAIKAAVAALFDTDVDVVNRDFLKPSIRPVAENHLIHAF
ncbi:MAG: nucleotidyltransferase family protein [Rhodomicrobium sp.]